MIYTFPIASDINFNLMFLKINKIIYPIHPNTYILMASLTMKYRIITTSYFAWFVFNNFLLNMKMKQNYQKREQ